MAYQPPYLRGANGQLQPTGLQGGPAMPQQQMGQPEPAFQQTMAPQQQNVNFGTNPFGVQAPTVPGMSGPIVDMYRNTFDRDPDQAGIDYWRGQQAGGMSEQDIQARFNASPEAAARAQVNAIPTGLLGSEMALKGGMTGALDTINQYGQAGLNNLSGAQNQSNQFLNQARGSVNQNYNSGVAGLQPYQAGGQQAFDQQGALSGTQGVAAQQAAYDNFNASPGQQWLQEQGNRQVLSGAAATGGLGGGEVQRDLNRFGQGLAQQDFGNQYARLAGLSGQGLNASTNIGTLRAQQGNALANLGQVGANQAFNFGNASANINSNMGANSARAILNTGNNLATGRSNFGNTYASDIGGAGGAAADLQNQAGAGGSDIIGGAASGAANAATSFGNLSAADQDRVMQMYANIETGAATQAANIQNPNPNYTGQFGDAITAAGSVADAFAGSGGTLDDDLNDMINDDEFF